MLHHRTEDGQRGVVLLLALIALLLISAVGAAIIYMAASESGFVGSERLSARALYADRAGLEEARNRMIPITPDAQGGVNNTDTINLADNTQAFALLPPVPALGAPPQDVLYFINTNNPNSPANFNVVGQAPGGNATQPASATNDPSLLIEIPAAVNVRAVAAIQPGAGTNASIPWNWVRANVKTELAAAQDLNLDGTTADQNPVFYYLGRQYRAPDLLAMNPQVLPPPWGPDPVPLGILDRPCVNVTCASPVYMLTALTTLPGPQVTSRLMREEVAVSPAFALNAAILSLPPITVQGTSDYYGYDGCDPDCAGFPPGTPPATCNRVVPLQSAAPAGSNVNGNSSYTYPPPPCPPPGTGNAKACVQQNVPYSYNVDELINMLRPMATPLTPGGYTGLKLGGFPFTDPINGTGADPVITYVGGDFKCTGGCSGAGILIVDGNLDFNASMEFYGIIIVRGNVTVLGGGSPVTGCNIYGALLSSGAVNTTLGGSICFRYNSCAQRSQFASSPLVSLSFREIPQ